MIARSQEEEEQEEQYNFSATDKHSKPVHLVKHLYIPFCDNPITYIAGCLFVVDVRNL